MTFNLHEAGFIAADVGSTTTKLTLFERRDGRWTFTRAESGTTVEKPHEDVGVGLARALAALERSTGRALLSGGRTTLPLVVTSSAGGGLAMVVTGLVKDLTAETADRVALGAGAIVLETLAMNDGRSPYRKIEDLKTRRPDIVLLAGGFDGDALSGPVFLAELLVEAGLHPKLNPAARLPVVYAGNVNATDQVRQTLGEAFLFEAVANVRPDGDRENPGPARDAIHRLFMEHVMSQAPGYERLKELAAADIEPTPAAFGAILARASAATGERILAVDIGGATTDVFSARDGRVLRTVSANLGMSYSILNTAETAGLERARELSGLDLDQHRFWNRVGNKLVRPTRLALDPEEMRVEWALATAAIEEAVYQHLAVLNPDARDPKREAIDLTELLMGRKPERPETVRVSDYDLVIGSGGILSHSPRPAAAMVLLDALRPEGRVELAADRAFLFPHLGALAGLDEALALELFREVGLVRLGAAGSFRGRGRVLVAGAELAPGELKLVPAGADDRVAVIEDPGGEDDKVELSLPGGEVGVIVDRRDAADRTGAVELVSGLDFRPEARGDEEPRRMAPAPGELRFRRELAIPGEVLVRVGDAVKPDTVVARSTRQFLRPFFLDPAQSLEVAPAEVAGLLRVRVGDDVEVGQVVAERKRALGLTRHFRSPVAGRVEKVLANGVLVVREKPEMARELTAVQVAKQMEVEPGRVAPLLKVEVGDEVDRGQWLASRLASGLQFSASPVRGRVAKIDLHFGIVLIEPLLEEREVKAWLPGEVADVSERGCEVRGHGTVIPGTWGRGGEAHGELALNEPGKGRIVAAEFGDARLLERCRDAGAAGLVCAGANLFDLLVAEVDFPVVVLAGFEKREFEPDVRKLLGARQGKTALVDGFTQLRVGVRRPRLVLPG